MKRRLEPSLRDDVELSNIDFLERKISGKEGILINIEELLKAFRSMIDEKMVHSSVEEKDVMRDHVEMAVYAAASVKVSKAKSRDDFTKSSNGSCQELRSPVRELSKDEIQKVICIGREHPWSSREDDTKNPAEWVADKYKDYIPGLLQCHIGKADPKLYAAFLKHASRKGLSGLDIPSAAENKLRGTPNEERGVLKASRQWQAASMRVYRASKAALDKA